jgi:arylsulfatase A-like enzyme/Tfp pilus assembly protein PilF
MRIRRRPARRAVAAAFVAALAVVSPAGAPKVNLLLVTLDTVRADHLGTYGYKLAATPVLDRIAREGVRFANATTPSPLTGPAHAGILTGVYPARYGIRDNAATPLPPEAVTLAETLKTAGYRTGAFIGAFILDRAYGFDQGFDTFDARFERFAVGDKLQVERPGSAVVKPALAWLAGLPAGQPFFAWIHFYDAHAPYTPPPPFNVTFRRHPYDGEIAAVDRAVGTLIAMLERKGILDQTLVVAIGDHGESLGEHGEEDHGIFLYDAVLHIPWLMRLPGRERADTVIDEQVRAIDLVPTVLDRLGITPPRGLDGETVLPVVNGRARRDPPAAYAETFYPKLHCGWSELRSVRTGEWKFVDAPRPELYALRSDAAERANVVDRQAGVASRLGAELRGVASAWSSAPATDAKMPDRETMERLRSLGYVGFTAPSSAGGRGPDPKDMVARLREYRLLITDATRHLKNHRPALAAEKLKQALAINGRAYDVHIALGDVYLQIKQYEPAIGEYEAAALLNPTSVDPLLAAASALMARGNLEQAGRKIDEADRLEPRSGEVAFSRGLLKEQQGLDAEAFAQYERAVAANPADARSHARLATSAFRLRRLDVAAEQYTRVIEMGYQPDLAQLGLGQVAELRGDRAAAIQAYRRALALDPGLTAAREGLARLGVKQ